MNIKEKFRHCGDTWKINNIPVYWGRWNQETNLKYFLKHGNGEKQTKSMRYGENKKFITIIDHIQKEKERK